MASVIRGDDNFDSASAGPSAALNAVGTYAFVESLGASAGPGETIPGANLDFSSATSSSTAVNPAGTWRCMGNLPADNHESVVLRIA